MTTNSKNNKKNNSKAKSKIIVQTPVSHPHFILEIQDAVMGQSSTILPNKDKPNGDNKDSS